MTESSPDSQTVAGPGSPGVSDSSALLPPPSPRHSRASSASSTLTAGTLDSERSAGHSLPSDLGDFTQGVIVCLHRKMMPQESYFLSGEKYSPSLFGLPLVVSLAPGSTGQEVYRLVWSQVARLISPLPPQEQTSNHAQDCDDSLGYEYPFVLKTVSPGGSWCSSCSWDRMCRGCSLPCSSLQLSLSSSFLAIDWDPTALHLRYLAAQERGWEEHQSVVASRKAATEPITLAKCLEAFTGEEELGDDDKIYCSVCSSHQPASKKLQVWRLPPVLIIHLKRFQYVNSRWIKSHKIVDFPLRGLEVTNYLAAVPAATISRHKELVSSRVRTSLRSNCATIRETSESLELADIDLDLDEDPNDSGIESSNGQTLERLSGGEVFDEEEDAERVGEEVVGARKRQISTSLVTDPVEDDNLKDFHEHHLEPGRDPLDIKYNMYAMVCHSGVMGGGHYVSFSKTDENKWFCHNDSTCKEIPENNLDKSSAYILMYEREGLSLKGNVCESWSSC